MQIKKIVIHVFKFKILCFNKHSQCCVYMHSSIYDILTKCSYQFYIALQLLQIISYPSTTYLCYKMRMSLQVPI